MNRRARFTQVEIARILRAAKAVGGMAVVLRPDGSFAVEPAIMTTSGGYSGAPITPADRAPLAEHEDFDL
jgi:hypothetical protein